MGHRRTDKIVRVEERRKHWRDRRTMPDRRNPERVSHSGFDCRSGSPRRASDISGEFTEGEVWWESSATKYDE
ncbi:MAG TPA: hypothetical protein ENJ64_05760 [Thiotrichales bacterium]|nr:hypothetical protein [Thiotrichales bacterium]